MNSSLNVSFNRDRFSITNFINLKTSIIDFNDNEYNNYFYNLTKLKITKNKINNIILMSLFMLRNCNCLCYEFDEVIELDNTTITKYSVNRLISVIKQIEINYPIFLDEECKKEINKEDTISLFTNNNYSLYLPQSDDKRIINIRYMCCVFDNKTLQLCKSLYNKSINLSCLTN